MCELREGDVHVARIEQLESRVDLEHSHQLGAYGENATETDPDVAFCEGYAAGLEHHSEEYTE